jgi:cobyrinic acid a,c-diamide synthase
MSSKLKVPRIVIAGTGGDSGKTIVSMGLAASWRRLGYKVAVFKKGPDYIDAAWLRFASGQTARNLDTYMMGTEGVQKSFHSHCRHDGVNLIEGNRGLYDGFDSRGLHSTAELAKLVSAPVVLVLDVTKVTRTAAALVLGCQHLDPDVHIAGVILNRVAGSRHEKVVRDSIETICGIPVLGAIRRISDTRYLPDRHLGLVTPEEHPELQGLNDTIAQLIDKSVDVDRILTISQQAPELETVFTGEPPVAAGEKTRIAYFSDSAFTFYYQDNLEALEAAGGELVPVSSLESAQLPPCDGLYIGGGFPETHAERLGDNKSLMQSVKSHAVSGLPVFAECGGLIYLCRSIIFKNKTFPLSGVFPIDLEMHARPQGHGYMEVRVDRENPFFPKETKIRGHEFHYSSLIGTPREIDTIYTVSRGSGSFKRRDGLIFRNVLASYLHIHAAGVPPWAENFVNLARRHKKLKE